MNNKTLYLIASSYPYGFGEPFLEKELPHLSKRFDKIYIIATESGIDRSTPRYAMPENCESLLIEVETNILEKITGIFKSLCNRHFYRSLFSMIFVFRLIPQKSRLKSVLMYFVKSEKFNIRLKRLIEETAGKSKVYLYTYWWSEFTYGISVLKSKNPDFVTATRAHGWDCYFERHKDRYLPLRIATIKNLDRVYAISEHGKRYLTDKFGEEYAHKIDVSYLGTSPSAYVDTHKTENQLNIISIAFISPVKRVDKLIDALSKIENLSISWTHIGGGPDYESVVKYAQSKLDPRTNIRYEFKGNLNAADIHHLLMTGDFHCLVNTSDSEGLPVSMMEAMSYGIPAIGPVVGGIPEIITHGQNGLLFLPLDSIDNVVSVITEFSSLSDVLYQHFRNAAYERFNNQFNAGKNHFAFAESLSENARRIYRQCSKCILDTKDYPGITFDTAGVCDICHTYEVIASKTILYGTEGNQKLENLIADIKLDGTGKEYDCIIGVSGGVDSSYLAFLTKKWGLRPYVVHVDNGWNSELAVGNIERLLDRLGYELNTYVINWPEMRDLQHAFIKAGVVDIDLPFDNAFMAILYRLAAQNRVKYILGGHNTATEGYLPPNFNHYKLDTLNIKSIHRRFGILKLKTFPLMGAFRKFFYDKLFGIKMYAPLDWIVYNKQEVKELIIKDFSWRDYGGKHYENVFTRFYQGYILPKKFGIDKRKSHLSTLICSGQITKEIALDEWKGSAPYPDKTMEQSDKIYFIKKMKMTEKEFEDYMSAPPISHLHYPSYIGIMNFLRPYYRLAKRLLFIS